jgi:Eukaryotic protein of unknown function (DUF829)
MATDVGKAGVVASAKQSSALNGFNHLSPKVWLYEPAQVTDLSGSPTHSPATIVLCAWMDAAPKHIEKYLVTYKKLYPTARILVITISLADFFLKSEAARRAEISPAVTVLLSPGSGATQSPPGILVHVFSNGGVKRLHGLTGLYYEKSRPHAALPASAVIFDSAPGSPQIRRDVHALMAGAPRLLFLRLPFAALTYILVFLLVLLHKFTPFLKSIVEGIRDGLNDGKTLSSAATRCYIYSEEDKSVGPEPIEAHAADAHEKGIKVIMNKFHGSGHVAHMKHDEGRYWDIVQRTWNESV